MLNDHSRGYMQNLLFKTILMALLYAFQPPAQSCRGEDIIYIFFLIFSGHRVLDLITNPYLTPSPTLGCTLLQWEGIPEREGGKNKGIQSSEEEQIVCRARVSTFMMLKNKIRTRRGG